MRVMANGSAVKLITSASGRSTIKTDTMPVAATGNELELAIKAFQTEVAGFAQTMIKDPAARADYIKQSRAACDEIIAKVKLGEITPHEGAKTANEMRNQIMVAARAKLTDLGAAISSGIKKDGLLLVDLQERYAGRRFGRAFAALSQAEKELVWMDIVHAAGGPRQKMNVGAKWFGRAGRGLLVLTFAIAVYNVIEAEDRTRQAAKEGVTLGAGAVGGIGAGAAVAFAMTGPPGWIVGLSMFAGAALLGVGSAEVFDYFWPESK